MSHNVRMQMLSRTLGYGVVLYALMYLAWGLLAAFGLAGTQVARFTLFIVLIASTAIAARGLRYESLRDIVPHSLSWVITIAIIDAGFASASGDWSLFADPNLWIGYALVAGTPLVFHAPPEYRSRIQS